jgi:hypothetical protein
VASEDTVLFTVNQYLGKLSTEQREHARPVLAPLIRCQHLSQYWLTIALDSTQEALADLRSALVKLLVMRSAQPVVEVKLSDLRWLRGAPPSWLLGLRSSRPVSSVSVTWDLDISTLRDTAQRCVTGDEIVSIHSYAASAPLGGFSFTMSALCVPQNAATAEGRAGCQVLFSVRYSNFVAGIAVPSFKFKLVTEGGHQVADVTPVGHTGAHCNLLQLGMMAGGWDEVAVAAQGLPTSGVLPITLTVSETGHMQRVPAPVGQRRQ